MPKYYDIHNHLFNKDFLAKELLYRLMKELKKMLRVEEEPERGIKEFTGKMEDVLRALKRFRYALKVFGGENSIAVYRELDKTYRGEFILTPLTFDLTWCFAASADRDAGAAVARPFNDIFDEEMKSMFDAVEAHVKPLSRDFNDKATPEEDELWREYLREKKTLLEGAVELREQHERNLGTQPGTRGIGGIPDMFDGFQEQIRQLLELKNHPDYKDMIYPFLAIDPRRPGIADYARAHVGKGKDFAGIKLYCPNGYSPTDPLLYGTDGQKDGIYAFCETNGIPVTAHNSNSGFATFSKSVVITGDIHFNGKLYSLNNENLKFKHCILEKEAIGERAVTLNHPMLWEKVVQKYPDLILNLAHFGGGEQLGLAVDDPADENLWSNWIIKLIKDPRYHIYTDISCFFDFEVIRKFIASPVYPEIRHKVLYGSDFTLILLFEDDFEANVRQFKECFGADFDLIAGSNPREFLKHVTG